ncbi:MAG: ABC transporter substrate-binding protein [Candidatus Velthaea sp.]
MWTFRRTAAALAAALLLAACTKVPDASAPGGGAAATVATARARHAFTIPHTLRIGDNQDITTLNPHLGAATSLGNLSEMTMAYLLRADAHNRPMPELATEVPTQANGGISADGRTLTWHLRRGVKWSDGAAFDADDVVFSTHAVLNPANNEIGRDGWDLITQIDEPDKYTVVFHLKKAYAAYFPTFFGSPGANPCILPKHLLGALPNINNAPYNSKPVGIGPFRVTEWVRSDHVTLEANPLYWRGAPKLQKVVYRIIPDRNTLLTQLQTGEIDMWVYVGPGYYGRTRAVPTVTVFRKPDYYYAHIDFNMTHAALRDPAVRQALRYATDRKTIVEKVNHGTGLAQEGMETPVSPMFHALPFVPFDIGKANSLLDAAGWVRGADGIRAKNGQKLNLEFALQSGNPDYDQLVELIRSTWQQIGVALQVRRYQAGLFFGPYQSGGIIYSGKFDAVFFSWGLDPVGDLSNLFECNQMPPAGQNDPRYCNHATDELLEAVKKTYEERARAELVAKVIDALDRDVPTVVLYVRDEIHAYNTDLHGWTPNQISPFDAMMNADI